MLKCLELTEVSVNKGFNSIKLKHKMRNSKTAPQELRVTRIRQGITEIISDDPRHVYNMMYSNVYTTFTTVQLTLHVQ